MAWTAKSALTGLGVTLSEVNNANTDYVATNHFSGWVTLNPGETADVQISVDFGATGGDMFARIVTTLDDAAEVADSHPHGITTVPLLPSSTVVRSILVTGVYKFRLEVRKFGTTAGAYTPSASIRKNGVNII